MASASALGDMRRVVDAARRALAVPASRSLSTGSQLARIGCGNLSHRRRARVPPTSARAVGAAWHGAGGRRDAPYGIARHHGGPVQSIHRDVRCVHLGRGRRHFSGVGTIVGVASISGFGWLVVDHLRAVCWSTIG